jgi:hypothetical protein
MLAKVKKTKKKHWIESKIVNLLFFFVNGLLWMITIWVLGFRCWLNKLLLNYDLSKYHFVQNLVVCLLVMVLKGGRKMSQHIMLILYVMFFV